MEIQGSGQVARPQVPTPAANPPEPVSLPATPHAAAVETAAAPGPASAVPNSAQVKSAVENINKTLRDLSQNLQFSVDDNRVIVKVVDQGTGEVLRQIPTEDVIEIAKAIETAQQGLLIHQKA